MGFLSRLLGGGSRIDDESFESQEEEFFANPAMAESALPACDELEGGQGPLGTFGNPIPVNGVQGEIMYMNRLRSASGRSFLYHRTSTADSDLTPYPLDRYELVAIDGSEWRVLYFSAYHPRRSQAVPPGFQKVPWPKDRLEQMYIRMPMGVGLPVEDFPYGLPTVYQKWAPGRMPEEMVRAVGRALEGFVEKLPPDLERPDDLNDEHYTPVDDEPFLMQIQTAQAIPDFIDWGMPGMEAFEEGEGDFGSRTNPIPVNGELGMVIYLNRLRSRKEMPFVYHRTGTVPSDLTEVGLERIELASIDGEEWHVLYFSTYHLRRSQRVPDPLGQAPWPSDERIKMMLKAPLGVLEPVENFPHDLAERFETWSKDRFPPEVAGIFLDFLQHHLADFPAEAKRPAELNNR